MIAVLMIAISSYAPKSAVLAVLLSKYTHEFFRLLVIANRSKSSARPLMSIDFKQDISI